MHLGERRELAAGLAAVVGDEDDVPQLNQFRAVRVNKRRHGADERRLGLSRPGDDGAAAATAATTSVEAYRIGAANDALCAAIVV